MRARNIIQLMAYGTEVGATLNYVFLAIDWLEVVSQRPLKCILKGEPIAA